MKPTSENDIALLDEVLASAAATIEQTVNATMQTGVHPAQLAIVLERTFAGEVRVRCPSRMELAALLGASHAVSAEQRDTLLASVATALPSEMPIVILVHREGYVATGVKRLGGTLVALS